MLNGFFHRSRRFVLLKDPAANSMSKIQPRNKIFKTSRLFRQQNNCSVPLPTFRPSSASKPLSISQSGKANALHVSLPEMAFSEFRQRSSESTRTLEMCILEGETNATGLVRSSGVHGCVPLTTTPVTGLPGPVLGGRLALRGGGFDVCNGAISPHHQHLPQKMARLGMCDQPHFSPCMI